MDKPTIDIDIIKKRLVFRAWHRGIKEMDHICGKYVDANIDKLTLEQLNELQYIMSFEDRDLFSWFMGEVVVPEDIRVPMFYDMLKFHNITIDC